MRIGLMGGTFDPIHIAHLVAASEVCQTLNLDQVLFIPAGNPWQKAGAQLSPGQTRLQLVDLAIAGDGRFSSSDIELIIAVPAWISRAASMALGFGLSMQQGSDTAD